MNDPGETDPRVSTEEAARILGVSPTTVREMVRESKLHADRGQYNGRLTYRIRLPADIGPAPRAASSAAPAFSSSPPLAAVEVNPIMDTSAGAPSDQTIAAVIQASITPIVAPLTAELPASRQMIERQVEQLVSQAETIGKLRAENVALSALQQPTGGVRAA